MTVQDRRESLGGALEQAADAIVELQSYGVASTADKFLEQIKQEVAESKAAVEVATGSIDTKAIEHERTARKVKAAGILQQRHAMYRSLRASTVAKFGEEGYRKYDDAYAFFVGLYEKGVLTGARFVIRKPS